MRYDISKNLWKVCSSFTFFIIGILWIQGCEDTSIESNSVTEFYVGTYTNGDSEGIYQFELREDGSLNMKGLMAKAENPSFLCRSNDGKYLLAVNEVSNKDSVGYVSSFEIKEDTLLFINMNSSGGAHPCHVTTNKDNFVVAANYTGGNMGLLRLSADGSLSGLLDVQQHTGEGSHWRQDGPHAHSGWFTDSGDLISVDLGTNQLWFSSIESTGEFVPGDPQTFEMEEGAGPRHLAIHPSKSLIYVVNELTSSVSVVSTDSASGNKKITQTISTLPANFSKENTCADIHISADGRYLYASNRGHNSICIFEVDAKSGMLAIIGHEPVRGESPRNFTISPDGKFLLVANQNTNNIISFHRDENSGMLTLADEIEAPSPVCLLF